MIDPFDDEALDKYTKTVLANSPYRDERLDRAGDSRRAIPFPRGPAKPPQFST